MSSGANLLSSSVATSRSMAVFPRSSSVSAGGLPHDDDDGRPYLPQKRRGPTAPLCAGRPAWSRMLTRYDAVAFSSSPQASKSSAETKPRWPESMPLG